MKAKVKAEGKAKAKARASMAMDKAMVSTDGYYYDHG